MIVTSRQASNKQSTPVSTTINTNEDQLINTSVQLNYEDSDNQQQSDNNNNNKQQTHNKQTNNNKQQTTTKLK